MRIIPPPIKAIQRAVLVEDQQRIRCKIKEAMESNGMLVFGVKTAQRGLRETANRQADMIVLDIDLPAGDGMNFIRNIRSWSNIPIIVLSTDSAEQSKIEILDAGADDYISKPFSIGELLARIRSRLRHAPLSGANNRSTVTFGDIHVDFIQRVVTRKNIPLKLTPTEYRLLTLLIFNERKVLTQRKILEEIWGREQLNKSHYLRIYIGGLRRKLETDTSHPQHILTETGIGYKFIT